MKLSIIVPIYKVEKYLTRCLESIRNQIFKDFECILLDDGSPDKCPAICDEYVKKDNRFRVIHKENEGLFFTVKRGIEEAQAPYVGFVDSDDFISSFMYLNMMELVDKYELDCVICNYKYFYNENKTVSVDFGIQEGLYEQDNNIAEFYKHLLPNLKDGKFIAGARWNKVIKKNILLDIIKNHTKKVTMAEDTMLTHPAMLTCKKIYYLNKDLYFYVRLPFSITGKYREEYFNDWYLTTKIYEPYQNIFSEKAIDEAKFYFFINNVYCFILRSEITYNEKKKYIKQVLSDIRIKKLIKEMRSVKKNRGYSRIYKILKFKLSLPYLQYLTIKNSIRKLIKGK